LSSLSLFEQRQRNYYIFLFIFLTKNNNTTMDTSFSSSTLKSTMKKYPTNVNNNGNDNDSINGSGSATTIIEPNSTWTIEQLLHWSLDQYHNIAMNRTATHIDALRSQCENECTDIMTLHEVAVSMKERGELMDEDNDEEVEGEEGGRAAEGVGEKKAGQQRVVRGENANPQQKKMKNDDNDKQMTMMTTSSVSSNIASSGGDVTTNSTLTHQTTNIQQQSSSSSNIKLKSSSSTPSTPTTLQITITSGPHTHQTYHLIPKPSQPCLIGRSKGKKFIKNGVSLNKDQEVSTTHGKISVEHVYLDGSGNGGMQTKFYYTDVGSTNGTTLANSNNNNSNSGGESGGGEEGGSDNNLRLEPNVRMEIPMNSAEEGGEEGGGGVELRLGNSTLKIVVVG
jgi:hypothetical protein